MFIFFIKVLEIGISLASYLHKLFYVVQTLEMILLTLGKMYLSYYFSKMLKYFLSG